MNTVHIPLVQCPDGSLGVPVSGVGQGSASVTYGVDQAGAKTALINFNGMNQALCAFDADGGTVINVTYLDITGSIQVQKTVQNIIRYLNASH